MLALASLVAGLLATLVWATDKAPETILSAPRMPAARTTLPRVASPLRYPAEEHAPGPDILGLNADGITAESWAEHALELSERMGGGVVTCTVGPSIPDGSVDVDLSVDAPREFPRHERTLVIDGRIAFSAPPGAGTARLQMLEVTRGRVSWEGAEIGSTVVCSDFEFLTDLVAVHGRIIDEGGEPADRAGVEGCGAHAYADDRTGEFVVFVEPGTCELRAVRRQNMGRADGLAVPISTSRGRDIFDVLLVAPNEPEWREATADEARDSRIKECEYWSGAGSRAVALVQSMGDGVEPGTGSYDNWQRLLKQAQDNADKSRRTYCDD
ncbi:MAG: hypothetical protein Q8P18_10975 [Pseudomonadota bacterium]|nr:hypothetical protein [Pseudomonadota bacterium]